MADAYFAPRNQLIFKMVLPGGTLREFERDFSQPGVLRGAEGWEARFLRGGKVEVCAPGGDERFTFDRGRIVRHEKKGVARDYPYETARRPPLGFASPLNPRNASYDVRVADEMEHKWDGSGRLAFPYVNPNMSAVLYAELMLLGLWIFAFPRRICRLVGGAAAVAAAVCLVLAGSRGAWISAGLALGCFGFVHGRKLLRSKVFWCLVVLAALGGAAWFLGPGGRQLSRGFGENGMGWSNAVRLSMLCSSPAMMVAAPGGWWFAGVGRAYLDWFQPLDVFCLPGSLINNHLTVLASVCWSLRFAYLGGVFFVLGLCGFAAFRARCPAPLAVWFAFFTAAVFNPVFFEWSLWLVPVAGLVLAAAKMPWRNARASGLLVGGAILAGVVATGCLWGVGRSGLDGVRPTICASGRAVLVNGTHPSVWVVDAGDETFGGVLAGKAVREYYSGCLQAPTLGYVRSVADLPGAGVRTLALGGRAGHDWLERISSDPAARRNLPAEVVFFSPPFPPSAIPPPLFRACRVKMVLGEFAARYVDELAAPQPWVEVVPGMEMHVLRWLDHLPEG